MSEAITARMRQHDPSDMYGRIQSLGGQIDHALAVASRFELELKPAPCRAVVVCGMGGSAIAGDLARDALGDRLTLPLVSVRHDTPPRWALDHTLLVFSSYSGNTAETLSAYDALREGTARKVAITSGGELARRCEADGVPVCRIPGGMPPRTALGYSLVPLLATLRAARVSIHDDAEVREAAETVRQVCADNSVDAGDSLALSIADALRGRLPVVYAASGRMEGVARRWVGQLAENAKTLAHHAVYPELSHNEIVGWNEPAEVLSNAVIVALEDPDDSELSRRQREIGLELIGEHAHAVIRVRAPEGGPLARILGTVALGDLVSFYLAMFHGVDPTPVERIDVLKQRLKEA